MQLAIYSYTCKKGYNCKCFQLAKMFSFIHSQLARYISVCILSVAIQLLNDVFYFIDYILDSVEADLHNSTDMTTLLPYLIQHRLVTRGEELYLSSMLYCSVMKSQLLLGYLRHKGPGSLQMFLCCLNLAHEHIGHKDIAEKLKQTMQANGLDCNDFCYYCR